MFEVADGFSSNAAQVAEVFFIGDERINKAIDDAFGEELYGDLLAIDRMEINEPYRGRGIGLAAIRKSIDIFGRGCQFAVLKPFPLQYEGNVDKDNKKDCEAATRKLRSYYRKMGFKTLRGSEYMLLHVDPRQPDVLL